MSESRFWSWFRTNEHRLRAAIVSPKADDPLFDELLEQLQREGDGLYFLMGGDADGEMEFIVTPEGDPEHFDAVESFVASAPKLDRWTIIAFKPPMGHEFVIRHEGASIDGTATWFRLEGDHVVLACGSFHPKAAKAYQFAAVELLDAVLGERLAAHVDTIEVVTLPSDPERAGFRRLELLASAMTQA